MGVPAYFAWWAKHYSKKILGVDYQQFVNDPSLLKTLYLDFNGAIHPAIRTDQNMALIEMNAAVIQYLLDIIDYVKPDHVYIAIDGVAPAAKMAQQRDRRYKSIKEARYARDVAIKYNQSIRKENIDFNMISPGTEFMSKLQQYLETKISQLTVNGEVWHGLKFTINGAGLPGEGEHKIMQAIRDKKEPEISLIYGLDADLMFLTIINCPNAILVRENVKFRGRDNLGFNEDYKYLYLSISHLYDIVVNTLSPLTSFNNLRRLGFKCDVVRPEDEEELCNNTHWYNDTELDHHRLIIDYAYICFFLGNDFLPHLPALKIRNGSLNELIIIYKKTCWALGSYFIQSDGMTVNRKFMREFLEELAFIEDDLLKQNSLDRVKSINSFRNRLRYMSEIKKETEKFSYIEDKYDDIIRGGTKGWRIRYYNYHEGLIYRCNTEFEKQVKPICDDYIKMSLWILHYYQGKHNNWDTLYLYNAAPSAQDLANFFTDIDTNIIFEDNIAVTPYVQLMSILPPESVELLPKPLRWYMVSNESPVHYMYPIKVEFSLIGNRFLHECKTRVPHIDREELNKIVNDESKYLTVDELKRNSLQNIVTIG